MNNLCKGGTNVINILIVDDHPSVREGTKSMIEKENDMVVTVAASEMQALELVENNSFDALLLDLNMPVINGMELTRRIVASNSDIPILIYTGYDVSPYFNFLVEAGVSGFISKTASREQLILAIRCALRGDAVIPISLLKQLRRTDIHITGDGGNETSIENASINEKEQAILKEIALGKSNKEIAQTLFMSQRTVEYNLTRIFNKLHVRSRAEAIVKAKRLGLVPNEDFLG